MGWRRSPRPAQRARRRSLPKPVQQDAGLTRAPPLHCGDSPPPTGGGPRTQDEKRLHRRARPAGCSAKAPTGPQDRARRPQRPGPKLTGSCLVDAATASAGGRSRVLGEQLLRAEGSSAEASGPRRLVRARKPHVHGSVRFRRHPGAPGAARTRPRARAPRPAPPRPTLPGGRGLRTRSRPAGPLGSPGDPPRGSGCREPCKGPGRPPSQPDGQGSANCGPRARADAAPTLEEPVSQERCLRF